MRLVFRSLVQAALPTRFNLPDLFSHEAQPRHARRISARVFGGKAAPSNCLVTPSLNQLQQRVMISAELLQRVAVHPWHNPGHNPARQAQLDDCNQRAVLLQKRS